MVAQNNCDSLGSITNWVGEILKVEPRATSNAMKMHHANTGVCEKDKTKMKHINT